VADAFSTQVVLIVEVEVLVRMTAVDMIEEAGFEVLEAANSDEANPPARGPARHHGGLHRYRNAGVDGRPQARPSRQGPLAAHQDHSDLPSGGLFLPKPYSLTQISSALRGLSAQA